MNKESLRKLPALVNSMDENLAINIAEFVGNQLLKDLKIKQPKLIEVIKSSHKFHYDNKTGTIKFREKADRNILMVNNFLKTGEESEVQEKENYIRRLVKEKNMNYANKIKKIDKVGNGFHVVFDHEDISMDVERYLLDYVTGEQKNDLFNDLKLAQICLAAESLKRRVVSAFDPNFSSLWAQNQFINSIILNPTSYIPRRFTVMDSNLPHLKRASISPSNKFDNVPQNVSKRLIHHSNTVTLMSKKNPQKNLTNHRMSIESNSMLQFSNMNSKRNSKVIPNKFDLVEGLSGLAYNPTPEFNMDTRNKAYTTYQKNKNAKNQQFENSKMDRRISYNPYNSYQAMPLSYNLKRNSYIPVHPDDLFLKTLPLNKEYEISIERDINLEEKDVPKIKYSYDTKEIVSVYFHMNFLRKFELPEELKSEFNPAFMTENPKGALESFKLKSAQANVGLRDKERSKSIFVKGNRRSNKILIFLYNLIIYFLIVSSTSRTRMSQQYPHHFMSDFTKGLQQRKRNTSVKN